MLAFSRDEVLVELRAGSMLRFAWADTKVALWTALRAFAWTTGGLGLALFAAVLLNPSRPEPLTAASVTATLVASLVYAALPGLVASAGAVLFRLAGGWAFLPLAVFPLVLFVVLRLGRGVLAEQGQDILNALGVQLQGRIAALHGVRIHSAEELVVVLLFYGLYAALQPPVLWELFQYLLLVVALIALALLLTCVVTLPPLVFAVMRRMRQRYAQWLAALPAG